MSQAHYWAIALGTFGSLCALIGIVLGLKAGKPLRCWLGAHTWSQWEIEGARYAPSGYRETSRDCTSCDKHQSFWGRVTSQ